MERTKMPKLRKLIKTTLPVSLTFQRSCITACHQRALLDDCSLQIGDDASPMTDFWSETTHVN